MKLPHIALIIAIAAATSFAVGKYTAQPTTEKKETAFERMMRTGTLRCGYYVFPPIIVRDPSTNKMSGFTVDMMEAIAAKTDIKIEWTEESTFGNWIPALQSNRYDAMCAPMWSDMALGREVIYSHPLFFAAIGPLVRADDTRFDGPDAMDRLNRPEVKIIAQEGNMILSLAKEALPKATILAVSAQMDGPTIIQNVLSKKADVVLLDKNAEIEYNKHNDVKLKMINLKTPLKAQPFVLPVPHQEVGLQGFLNNAILDLHYSGTIRRLLNKWEAEPGTFLRVKPTYEK